MITKKSFISNSRLTGVFLCFVALLAQRNFAQDIEPRRWTSLPLGTQIVGVAYGYTDGDIIQVLVNDDIVHPRVYLTGRFKGFKLDLQPGFNKIDFLALNQGESGPNTAEFKVLGENGEVLADKEWNILTGYIATLVVMKK